MKTDSESYRSAIWTVEPVEREREREREGERERENFLSFS